MSIEEPTTEELDAVDVVALDALTDQVQRLAEAGTLDVKTFAALRVKALAAAGGVDSLIQSFDMFNPRPPSF